MTILLLVRAEPTHGREREREGVRHRGERKGERETHWRGGAGKGMKEREGGDGNMAWKGSRGRPFIDSIWSLA